MHRERPAFSSPEVDGMTNHEFDQQAPPGSGNSGELKRSSVEPSQKGASPSSSALDRWLARYLLRAAGNPNVGVVLWDGYEVGGPQRNRLLIRDRRILLRFITCPSLAFGDGYSSGRIEILGDMRQLLQAVFDKLPVPDPPSLWTRFCESLPWSNPLARARDNIYHHYDLGNEFYRLWLDERMVYTCAYFPDPACSLEEAQVAKMEHVCRKVWLRPGETVVEAGCGWGALARHMARHHGVTVKAFNISKEQIAFAREQAQREGLADRVEFIEDDFRNISGHYDAFVSVGMLEHVHPRNYPEFARVIERSLKPSGRGLIHSIGYNQFHPMDPWLEQRIFPGARVPSLREALSIMEGQNFTVLDVENLRLHYARTMSHWLDRFENVAEKVEMMFDPAFVRSWRFYLVSVMTMFLTGIGQLYQIVFAPYRNDDIPQTRAYLYRDSGGRVV
jgi:cyclopropane-fatty-acyl-phospholipid synthase